MRWWTRRRLQRAFYADVRRANDWKIALGVNLSDGICLAMIDGNWTLEQARQACALITDWVLQHETRHTSCPGLLGTPGGLHVRVKGYLNSALRSGPDVGVLRSPDSVLPWLRACGPQVFPAGVVEEALPLTDLLGMDDGILAYCAGVSRQDAEAMLVGGVLPTADREALAMLAGLNANP